MAAMTRPVNIGDSTKIFGVSSPVFSFHSPLSSISTIRSEGEEMGEGDGKSRVKVRVYAV